jgi:ribosome-associated protein
MSSNREEFKIEGEYIELIQLIKALGIAQTGGHAKMIVDEGLVKREGEREYRRRAKLRPGETVVIHDTTVELS